MDGGYINEGGQMKSMNGQKYVINHRRHDGYYVSKSCAILWLLLALASMLTIFLLTYFLMIPSCALPSSIQQIPNDTIYSSSIVGDRITRPRLTTIAAIHNGHDRHDDDLGDYDAVPNDDASAVPNGKSDEDELKLYEGWSPEQYDLLIEPDLKTGHTNGTVTIRVKRDLDIQQVMPIVLDIKQIKIYSTKVATDTVEVPFEAFYGDYNQSYHIVLKDSNADLTKLNLHLSFISQLSDTMQGIYRGEYKDTENDASEAYVSTQFSPIDARKAFPCFDRPDKKAVFNISIVRPLRLSTCLSNMRHLETKIYRHGYALELFAPTPRLPTYLVAFHLSNLHKAKISMESAVSLPAINIYARKEVSSMTRFAYEYTTNILTYLQDYFKVKLNLDKIDLIAVPDFGFNAMENTGMITFKETALIVPERNNKSSSAKHKMEVAKALAHELTHHWFGNLVSMKWWNDLWLKEGFATYFSYKCLNEIVPEWRMLDLFPFFEQRTAMGKDSDRFAHPISFDVRYGSDVRRIFDPISYSKGAAIVGMINSFLGEAAFQDGIHKFLNRYEYGNAVQDDLWAVLTSAGRKHETLPKNITVKDIMDSYTLQPGYPVLNVSQNGSDIVLTQKRYLLPTSNHTDKSKWFIPITYATRSTRGANIPEHWLSDSEDELVLENAISDDEWIHININRSGYYRVNYEPKLWSRLVYKLGELDELTRSQLVDDAFNLARAGFAEYDVPLTFLLVLGGMPRDAFTWAAAESGLVYLTQMVRREPVYELYRALMVQLFKRMFESLGFLEQPNESDLQVMHRARMLKLICDFKVEGCTHKAQLIYRTWIQDKKNTIPPNLKLVVYCTSIREGNIPEWQFAYKRYLETTNVNEKQIILSGLGCTTETFLLSKYLNLTISPTSSIRKQDAHIAFESVAKNYMGYETAFDFLYTNIEEIAEYFGDGFQTLSKMIESVTTYMNREYHQQQFERFARKARKLGLKSIEKSIHLAEENIRNNIFWRNHMYPKLQGYLEKLVSDMQINV